MKECNKCKEYKSLENFGKRKKSKDGLHYYCKLCLKEITLSLKEQKKNYDKINNLKNKSQRKEKYNKNKEEYLIKQKERNSKLENKEKARKYNTKPEIKERRNKRKRERHKNDIQYKLGKVIRSRIYASMKSQHLKKSNKLIELLGMSQLDYQIYLESQFLHPFKWSNIGIVWEIDHIKPCSKYDLTDPEQVKECFHYSNTRPIFKTTAIAQSYGYIDQIGNRNKSNNII